MLHDVYNYTGEQDTYIYIYIYIYIWTDPDCHLGHPYTPNACIEPCGVVLLPTVVVRIYFSRFPGLSNETAAKSIDSFNCTTHFIAFVTLVYDQRNGPDVLSIKWLIENTFNKCIYGRYRLKVAYRSRVYGTPFHRLQKYSVFLYISMILQNSWVFDSLQSTLLSGYVEHYF